MPRAGLTPTVIARAAAAVVDREGPASLTLARIADALGVRPPSLYNHVDGLDGLERLVALEGLEQLVDVCRGALVGRSGSAGLRAVGHAYRDFARAHPGVYPLAQVARPGDTEYQSRAQRLLDDLLVLLSGFGVPDDELIHAARAVRSTLHGFAMLEVQQGFGLDVDVDESFEWLLGSLERWLAG
jgi:AcrR family transcriptional regulator